MFIVKVGNDLRNLGYTNYREILNNIDFDDKDIYQKEYDKIYNKLIKKYPPEKADILTKQKLYTKDFKKHQFWLMFLILIIFCNFECNSGSSTSCNITKINSK